MTDDDLITELGIRWKQLSDKYGGLNEILHGDQVLPREAWRVLALALAIQALAKESTGKTWAEIVGRDKTKGRETAPLAASRPVAPLRRQGD